MVPTVLHAMHEWSTIEHYLCKISLLTICSTFHTQAPFKTTMTLRFFPRSPSSVPSRTSSMQHVF